MSGPNLFNSRNVETKTLGQMYEDSKPAPGTLFNQAPQFTQGDIDTLVGNISETQNSAPGAVFEQGQQETKLHLVPTDEEISSLLENIGPSESAKKAVSEKIVASRRARLSTALGNIGNEAVMSA